MKFIRHVKFKFNLKMYRTKRMTIIMLQRDKDISNIIPYLNKDQ